MSATTYEVRESSRLNPWDSTLLQTCGTYAEAFELGRQYAARGVLAFVREVAPSLPPAAAEPDAYKAGWDAYDRRVGCDDNPYDHSTHPRENDLWAQGWFDAELDHEHDDDEPDARGK